MKRVSVLVDYASSDEETDPEVALPPPPKKRKLPSLASNLIVPAPKDNPALHQGRIRSSPHVEGQFATHVYIPLKVTRGSSLDAWLSNVVARAKQVVPSLQPIGVFQSPDASEREFHVSLTRPVYLRVHQRDEFRSAIRAVCRAQNAFSASLTTFAELTNDERTRTFLTVELGAGHRELEMLCDALVPILRTYRQKQFYERPRFHISVAWALLGPPTTQESPSLPDTAAPPLTATATEGVPESPVTPPSVGAAPFPTIPHFPPSMTSALEKEFGASLRSRNVGMFEANCVCVKIGKDVHRWKLSETS